MSTVEQSERHLLGNVQALRALAAAMVVVFHLAPLIKATRFPLDVGAGAAGVDVFFVISGFIMIHIARDRTVAPVGFLRNRAKRIVPLYWIMTLIFAAAGALFGIWRPDAEGMALLARSLAFLPSGEPPLFYPLLFVGWSLNIEVYFYLVFAGVLAVAHGAWARTGIVAALLAVPVLLVACGFGGQHPATLYGNPIVLEFAAGMTLGAAWPNLARVPVTAGWFVIALAPVLLVTGQLLAPALDRVLGFGVPAFVLVAGALVLDRHGRSVSGKAVLLVGGASYSLYLSHPLVVSAFNNIARRIPALHQHGLAELTVVTAFAAAILAAVAIHLAVERPLARWLGRSAIKG